MLPLKRILCPTDFSDFSYEAIEEGTELARHFGAELCVLYVAQPVPPIYGMSPYPEVIGVSSSQQHAVRHANAERVLNEIIARHHSKGVRVRAFVRSGSPADEIAAAAEEEKADLIILPTHGQTGWRSHIFGSVAEKVLRIAHCPVLIKRVRELKDEGLEDGGTKFLDLTTSPRKILCSTDFSEPSFAALQVAGEWATHFDAELFLIHVVEPMESAGLILSREQIEEAMQAEAVQQLHAVLRERLPQLAAARPIVRSGSAADEIAAVADEIAAVAEQEDIDLIVIATHGSGGWRAAGAGTTVARIVFGSVTTNAVRLTHCPILTVRLPPEPGVFEVG